MDALVEDSVAFALASFAVMAWQLVAAAAAVSLANWAAGRMVGATFVLYFVNLRRGQQQDAAYGRAGGAKIQVVFVTAQRPGCFRVNYHGHEAWPT